MDAALRIAGLWLLFGASHVVLSSRRVRPALVARLGQWPFVGLYSVLALALFVPLVRTYFAHKHAGPVLWIVPMTTPLRAVSYGAMAVALVFLAAGLMRPSPAGVVPGDPTPHGIYRITRHPLFMGLAVFGLVHLVPNGSLADIAFFGGFPVFVVLGCLHQDRRKLADGPPGFRRFHAATPFLPFTGRETLRGLRELPPVAIGAGIVLAVVLRAWHAAWFGG